MGIFDDLLGRTSESASNRAAADTYDKQRAAAAGLRTAGDNYYSGMTDLAGKYQPYEAAGRSALARAMAGLGLAPGGEDFTAAYRALPGYASGLATGQKATENIINAGDMGQSGKALKALYRFGSDYEDQRSKDYLGQLLGLTGLGQQATGADVATQSQGLGGRLSAYTGAAGQDFNSAGTIGQGMVAGAQARQSAIGNLLNTAAYLGGSAMGAGMPRMSGFSVPRANPATNNPLWGSGVNGTNSNGWF